MNTKSKRPFNLSINNPKTFKELMKESISKSISIKSPKSGGFILAPLTAKEKPTNPLKTLGDLCSNTSSNFRELSSHRILKPCSTVSPFRLDMKSQSPLARNYYKETRNISQCSLERAETNSLLNAQKIEENEHMQIQQLLEKARKILERHDTETEQTELEALQKNLQMKDLIIEIYQQLIKVCSKKKKPLLILKKNTNNIRDTTSKKESINKGKKYDLGLRSPSMIDSQYGNSSFNNTVIQKSTNPTLSRISHISPSIEKNDSPYTSKLTDQESFSHRGETSPLLKSSLNSSPLQVHLKPMNKIDNRVKTLESIYKFGLKHFKKDSLTPLQSSPNLKVRQHTETGYAEKMKEKAKFNKRKGGSVYHFTEPDASTMQEYTIKSRAKLNSGSQSVQDLNAFVKRFDFVLSRYEAKREKLLKLNKEIQFVFEQKTILKSK